MLGSNLAHGSPRRTCKTHVAAHRLDIAALQLLSRRKFTACLRLYPEHARSGFGDLVCVANALYSVSASRELVHALGTLKRLLVAACLRDAETLQSDPALRGLFVEMPDAEQEEFEYLAFGADFLEDALGEVARLRERNEDLEHRLRRKDRVERWVSDAEQYMMTGGIEGLDAGSADELHADGDGTGRCSGTDISSSGLTVI